MTLSSSCGFNEQQIVAGSGIGFPRSAVHRDRSGGVKFILAIIWKAVNRVPHDYLCFF